MEIGSVMKREVVWLDINATLEDAIELIIKRRIGLLPLVDAEKKLIGILNLRDILDLAWPTFMDMIEDYDFVHDFGVLEMGHLHEDLRRKPVTHFIQKPISVPEDCGLLRAAAVMSQHHLRDLPVVDAEGRLVGVASWVDVGVSFLSKWRSSEEAS